MLILIPAKQSICLILPKIFKINLKSQGAGNYGNLSLAIKVKSLLVHYAEIVQISHDTLIGFDKLDIKTHIVKKDSDDNDPKFLPWPKTPGSSSPSGPVITSLNPLLEWYPSPDDPTMPWYLSSDIVRISEYPYGRNNVVYEGHAYRFNNSTLQIFYGTLEPGKRYCWSVRKWGGAMTFSECIYFQTR